ncbi:uncharacterized protein LOC143441641 [Arvicanthis niloticus]|uniref:uncharacterized protein LOC143441641 n=1 Tax=Arvicanthis niloticus TaxID=61156 RepID=UPI00403C7AF6
MGGSGGGAPEEEKPTGEPTTSEPRSPGPRRAAGAGTRTSCRRGPVHPGGRPPAAVIVRRTPPTSVVRAPGSALRAAGQAGGGRPRSEPSKVARGGGEGGAGGVGGERAPGRRGRLDARPERHSRGEERRRAGGGRVPAPHLRPAPSSPQPLRPRRDQPPLKLVSGKCGPPPPLPGPGPSPRQGEPGHCLGTAESHSPLQRPSSDLRRHTGPAPLRSAPPRRQVRRKVDRGQGGATPQLCLTWACGRSQCLSCTTKPSAGRSATAETRAMVPGVEQDAKARRSQQQLAGDSWH